MINILMPSACRKILRSFFQYIQVVQNLHTDKKEKKIFLIYKELRWERLQSHIWWGLHNIWGNAQIFSHILGGPVRHKWLCDRSLLDFFTNVEIFFYQCALIKKKIKLSSYMYIRKFRVEQFQSHIWLTASSYMGKYYAFPHIWLCNCSTLNFLINEGNFFLAVCRVRLLADFSRACRLWWWRWRAGSSVSPPSASVLSSPDRSSRCR